MSFLHSADEFYDDAVTSGPLADPDWIGQDGIADDLADEPDPDREYERRIEARLLED